MCFTSIHNQSYRACAASYNTYKRIRGGVDRVYVESTG